MKQNIYERKGYCDRAEYLEDVADTYGLDLFTVQTVASMLGRSEDFDGLLSECADIAGTCFMNVGDEV